MITARSVACALVEQYPTTAMNIALEIVRLIGEEQVRAEASKAAAKFRQKSKPRTQEQSAKRIVSEVCHYFGAGEREVLGKRRLRSLVVPRHVIWTLVRTRLGWSHSQIGEHFGVDHTTVLNAVWSVDKEHADVLAICQRLDEAEESLEAAE